MNIWIFVLLGFFNLACFTVGAIVGQRVKKDEPVRLPSVHPIASVKKAARKHKDQKKSDREQEHIQAIIDNIERYDGTPYGQRDVPGR